MMMMMTTYEHIQNICVFVGFISAVSSSPVGWCPTFPLMMMSNSRVMCAYVDWCRAAPGRRLWADLPRLGLPLESLGSHCPLEDKTITYSFTADWLTLTQQFVSRAHTHACDYSFCMARTLGKTGTCSFHITSFTVNTSPINHLCLSLGIEPVCFS